MKCRDGTRRSNGCVGVRPNLTFPSAHLQIVNDHAIAKLVGNTRSAAELRARIPFQPSVLRTLSPQAELVLGPRVGISAPVICAAVSIRIGEGPFIGAGMMILDNDFHHPVENFGWGNAPAQLARPIRIGRGAFIGARAIMLKGVTIGDRAVVGAGAVVTCDVPDRHLAVGNPAQIQPWKGSPPASP